MRIDRIKLKMQLVKYDMRQCDLAEKSGVSYATINGICTGRSCSPETAHKIATALNVPIETLMEQ